MAKTIGVLGGMGPLATADLYRKIIEATPARRDQEHLHVIIDADPAIPDRTAALRGEGPDPIPLLRAAAERLEAAGADFLVVPCNTVHAFLPRLREQVAIPILDMIEATAARTEQDFGGRRVGVLATEGTVESGLYERALAARGLPAINPEPEDQKLVGAAIEHVKAGEPETAAEDFATVGDHLVARGAEVLIAGCTEIPLVLAPEMVAVPLVDPTRILAEVAVREAMEPA